MTDRNIRPGTDPNRESASRPQLIERDEQLLSAAYRGDLQGIKYALSIGADINAAHPATGLCALHMAVGANDLALCKFIIEECGGRFFADGFGRWPTVIAAECRADDKLSEYILEEEARFLDQKSS